ncbi:MAG: TetR/AcrR family transcriptional regulator, partial [Alphaproteobacteria bacterium]|nr:TetR/AcrR family transcriptional regulator [Alphaproteobacteria bacterium]
AATSMSTIAARCGGSKATLYNYFSSKEELFLAVVRDRCDQVALVFDQDLDAVDDLAAQLQRFGEDFLSLVLADDAVASYRIMIAECARFPEIGQTFYESGPALGQAKLSAYFGRAIERKLLRPGDTRAMARIFIHLCLADLHQRRLFNAGPKPGPIEIRGNVERAVQVLLASFGPSKTPFTAS